MEGSGSILPTDDGNYSLLLRKDQSKASKLSMGQSSLLEWHQLVEVSNFTVIKRAIYICSINIVQLGADSEYIYG